MHFLNKETKLLPQGDGGPSRSSGLKRSQNSGQAAYSGKQWKVFIRIYLASSQTYLALIERLIWPLFGSTRC
jgi:hypothetical protein